MSLIEEALRRAQQPPPATTPSAGAAPSRSPKPTTPALPPLRFVPLTNTGWWVSLALGGMLLGVLTLWGYSIVLRWQVSRIAVPETAPLTSSTPATAPELAQPIVAKPLSTTTPVASLPPTSSSLPKRTRPELILNGVVEGRGEPLAIINGLIVRIGDSVAGAMLLEIRGEEARLRWRDEEWLLSTAH